MSGYPYRTRDVSANLDLASPTSDKRGTSTSRSPWGECAIVRVCRSTIDIGFSFEVEESDGHRGFGVYDGSFVLQELGNGGRFLDGLSYVARIACRGVVAFDVDSIYRIASELALSMSEEDCLVPLMLTGSPRSRPSRAVSLEILVSGESTPDPQPVSAGVEMASWNMMSDKQLVASWALSVFFA